mmetsp:Transcript_43254/g.80345  ORF Transcript_43254/g.80345 Transcript_43254/m.80345 type:complete len:234 (-) Transcript_43254:1361-2062(-)
MNQLLLMTLCWKMVLMPKPLRGQPGGLRGGENARQKMIPCTRRLKWRKKTTETWKTTTKVALMMTTQTCLEIPSTMIRAATRTSMMTCPVTLMVIAWKAARKRRANLKWTMIQLEVWMKELTRTSVKIQKLSVTMELRILTSCNPKTKRMMIAWKRMALMTILKVSSVKRRKAFLMVLMKLRATKTPIQTMMARPRSHGHSLVNALWGLRSGDDALVVMQDGVTVSWRKRLKP